ncbi:MAG: glycosyltransferase family 39 protein [Candidatus Roizmanbacteria bacterium]|nr:glycosyltransferase family 39 protein [Candidatus Roizmanbacteria bacterium]
MLKKRSDLIFYSILAVISFFTFYSLVHTFYQQDEWMAHGHFLVEGPLAFINQYSFVGLLAGGGRLPAQLFQYFLFTVFPFNIALISLISIAIHTLNSFLVYNITHRILKNKIVSFVSALFFLTASSAHQSITWVGASISTVPSAFFALISLWYYLRFLEKEKKIDATISFASLFLSYFTKQSALFLFLLYPVMYVLRRDMSKKTLRKVIVKHIPLVIFLLIIIAPFFIGLFFREQTSENVFVTRNPLVSLASHTFSYPVNSLSQMYFFPGAMFSIAKMFAPDMTGREIETIGATTASFIISMVLLAGTLLVYRLSSTYRKPIVFSLLFTLMSFLPFVALEKTHAYLDSRYYYLGTAGAGLLLSSIGFALHAYISKKYSQYGAQVAALFLGIVFTAYTISNIYFIHREVNKQTVLAQERIQFLHNLDVQVPKLPHNPVLYITGNAEYLLPGNYAPFQQGMGFTLMTWYYPEGNVPGELIKKDYLWQLGGEGYAEIEGNGFGYYANFSTLKQDYSDGKLTSATIIGLYYDAHSGTIETITDQVIAELEKT